MIQSRKMKANEPMDLIPMPSALLSYFLLAQEIRQKQVGIGHRGRWAELYQNALPRLLAGWPHCDFGFSFSYLYYISPRKFL